MSHPYTPGRASVHIIHLPSKQDVENHLDDHISSLEYADIITNMKKGIDTQVDMTIILNCACSEVVPDQFHKKFMPENPPLKKSNLELMLDDDEHARATMDLDESPLDIPDHLKDSYSH